MKLATKSAALVPLLQSAHAANSIPFGLDRLLNIDKGGMCSIWLGLFAQ